MKKIKSIYVREIGRVRNYSTTFTRTFWGALKFIDSPSPITYNPETNTYHQGNTEYKGEYIISVTYE